MESVKEQNSRRYYIIAALKKSGWKVEPNCSGAIQVYRDEQGNRVGIHYHPKKTYGAKLLQGLLDDIGWTESDLKKLKLIK